MLMKLRRMMAGLLVVMVTLLFTPAMSFADDEEIPLTDAQIDSAVQLEVGVAKTGSSTTDDPTHYVFKYTPQETCAYAFVFPKDQTGYTPFPTVYQKKASQLEEVEVSGHDVSNAVFALEQNVEYYFVFRVDEAMPSVTLAKEKELTEGVGTDIHACLQDGSYTPAEDGVYTFKTKTTYSEEIPFFPTILYFEGKELKEPSVTINSLTDQDKYNYVYHYDSKNGGILKLKKDSKYYFYLNYQVEPNQISHCSLEKARYNTLHLEAGTGGYITGNPYVENPASIDQIFIVEDDDSTSFYAIAQKDYEISEVYLNGIKVKNLSIVKEAEYVFKDMNGNVIKNSSEYTSCDGVIGISKEDPRFTGNPDANSIPFENQDEEYNYYNLGNFMKIIGAKSYELKRECYFINIYGKISIDETNRVVVEFKKTGSTGGSGGGAIVTPPPVQEETTKTETVTNLDGSSTTVTTEKDDEAGIEAKTEVTDKTGDISAKTEVNVTEKPVISGDSQTATIKESVVNKIIDKIKEIEKKASDAGASKIDSSITLNITGTLTLENIDVVMPANMLEKIVSQTQATVTIKTPLGELNLNQKTLENATKESTVPSVKLTIEIMQQKKVPEAVAKQVGDNATIFNFKLQAGDKNISSFNGGKAIFTVDIPKALNAQNIKAVFVKDNGMAEKIPGRVVNGKFQMDMTHFSYYALVDEVTADKAVDASNQKIAKGVKNTRIVSVVKTASKGKVKLTWKKTAGYKLDGYEISKSTKKNGGYKKMAVRKGQSYTNNYGLKKGKTYWYKIRGFREVDGKRIYTDWKKISVRAK